MHGHTNIKCWEWVRWPGRLFSSFYLDSLLIIYNTLYEQHYWVSQKLFCGEILTSIRALILRRSLPSVHFAANYNMHKAAVTFALRLRNRVRICEGASAVQGIRTVSSKLFVGSNCLFVVVLAMSFRNTSLSVYCLCASLLSFFFTLRNDNLVVLAVLGSFGA